MTLIEMTRGEGEVAIVRLEWAVDWQAYGWILPTIAAPLDLTRDGIGAMDKPELLELLEAHGWDGDKRLGVDKLREALIGIVFI